MTNNKSQTLKCTLCVVVAVLGWSLSTQAQSKVVDKVVAKVGSELVLLSELEDQYQYIAKQEVGVTPELKCDILQNLIAQKVIVYQAKLDSVEVTDQELESQLDYRFESILRQMNGDESFFKEYYGFTVAEMRDRIREEQRQQILSEKMQGQLINEVSITPQEVEEFYNAIPTDSLPYLSAEVEISEIVIKPQVNDVERKKTLEKITDVRRQIEDGAITFEEAAKKYSTDATAARGGDLGFAKRGVYVPEFEAAAFQLKKDEMSDVVETEFGFHIIQLIERRGNSIHARHILIPPAITTDDEARAQAHLDSIRNLVQVDSMSFEAAVKRFGIEDVPSYGNSGRVKNNKTGNTFFETGDLDPDIYFEIIDLKPGDLTEVIETKDLRGNTQYKVIQLVSQSRPHKASLETDYNKISLFAKQSKKNKYFNDWVTEKMADTYITVDDSYEACPTLKEWIKEKKVDKP